MAILVLYLINYPFDIQYSEINKIRETKNAKNSLKTLIDNKLLIYKSGNFLYKSKRFLMNESHILFLVEKETSSLENSENIIFDIAFKEGEEIAKIYGGTIWEKFLIDFLPPLGFGDILILNSKIYEIGIIYYPWSKLFNDSKYLILRGIISGIISFCTNKTIKLNLKNYQVKEYVNIIFSST